MRILIDECVNPRVRQAFPHHEVITVAEAEWRTLPDEKLVSLAQVAAVETVRPGEVVHVRAATR